MKMDIVMPKTLNVDNNDPLIYLQMKISVKMKKIKKQIT